MAEFDWEHWSPSWEHWSQNWEYWSQNWFCAGCGLAAPWPAASDFKSEFEDWFFVRDEDLRPVGSLVCRECWVAEGIEWTLRQSGWTRKALLEDPVVREGLDRLARVAEWREGDLTGPETFEEAIGTAYDVGLTRPRPIARWVITLCGVERAIELSGFEGDVEKFIAERIAASQEGEG